MLILIAEMKLRISQMTRFLVDTNVISEQRKGNKANAGVKQFWREVDP